MKRRSGTLRCALYLRCSTDDQKHGDFTTIQAQRDINSSYVAGINGVIAGEYADEGRTGTNLKRPEWNRLIVDARAGLIDAVVVSYMSRLGRGEVYYIAEYLLKEAGIQVLMVKEQFTTDLAGYANKSMKIFLDGMYPKQVSEWTKTKMEQMVAHGYRCGGTLPFGYSAVYVSDPALSSSDKEPPKRLVINEAEAPFVLRAFEIFVETGSYERVRSYLTSTTDLEWSLNKAIYLIKNPAYIGALVFGQWRNDHAHEAIITANLWQQTQERLQVRIKSPKKDPVDNTAFYLRGIVWCEHCGYRMTPANHHGRIAAVRYYECLNNTKNKKACPVKRVNANSLHNAVIEHIRRAVNHPTRMVEIIREAAKTVPVRDDLKNQINAVSKRLKDTEKRTKSIVTAIEAGGAGLTSLLTRLEELQIQASALQTEKYQLEAITAENRLARPNPETVMAHWKLVLDRWDEGTDEEKTELLPLIVNRVGMTEKEHGYCRLSFSATNPRLFKKPTSDYVVNNFKMGAHLAPDTTYYTPNCTLNSHVNPDHGDVKLCVPKGGNLRKQKSLQKQSDIIMIEHQ